MSTTLTRFPTDRIEAIDGTLRYTTQQLTRECPLALVSFVRLVPGSPPAYPILELKGGMPMNIPLEIPGMAGALAALQELPGFDQDALASFLRGEVSRPIRLWRRGLLVDTVVVSGGVPATVQSELAAGLLLLAPTGEPAARRIPWAVTYDELATAPGVVHTRDARGRLTQLGLPVEICELRLPAMNVTWPLLRTNVPVANWFARVVVTEAWETNYWQLKAHLSALLERTPSPLSYERENGCKQLWTVAGLEVSLSYWRETDWTAESGYCQLDINNARYYPEYLTDPYIDSLNVPPTRGWMLSTFTVPDVTSVSNFRASRWIRRTPAAVRAALVGNATWAVWRDENAGMLGFSTRAASVVIPQSAAVRLLSRSGPPARGRGYDAVQLEDSEGQKVFIAQAGYGALRAIKGDLAQLTRLDVLIEREFPDD